MGFMKKYAGKIQAVILIAAIFVAGFAVGTINSVSVAQSRVVIGDTDEAFAPLWEVFNTIQASYVDSADIDVPLLVNGAITGMVESLGDRYSNYIDPSAFDRFNSDLSGNFEGIGVVIETNPDTNEIYVTNVLRGSPALGAGVLPGDIFYSVDGTLIEGLDQTALASLVRGPAGSTVNITFKRGTELINLAIVRARIELPNVETDILDNNIAYVSLNNFNSVAVNQIRQALEEVDVNNRNGLVFDLRGNPGGLLSSAIDVGSLFIRDGVLLYETFADGSEQTFEVNGNYANINVPIVVLVNENSASASELVAGAIKDRGAGTLIGETTFGKGTVQTIQPLSNGGGLRLTIARYLLPSRQWIHDVGVVPDIAIDYDPFEDGATGDLQLEAAIRFLSESTSNTPGN